MNEQTSVVVIVDDDASFRSFLVRLIGTVGIKTLEFSSAEDFLKAKLPDAPTCLVLDVQMPGLSGLDLQKELSRGDRRLPIIFITGHGDIPMTVKAMKSGAADFLTKPFRDQDLIDAIQRALKSSSETRQEQNEIAHLKERYANLTAREREVMSLIVSNMLTKRITSTLGTSEVTASVHRGQIMRKMQANSPAELGRMAEKLKLSTVTGADH